ncbi:hypothetical protein ABDD95_19370 [Mucilaginibacter sp. PAMB04274]|uniref:hypothetical protein n=1 Tax=Mucilaginibacter sp. PAMB04274 TaxID=3138568 RepID=UPI0031F6864C
MNWLQFILTITGVYTLYYLVIILTDVAGTVHHKAGAALNAELTFEEPVIAQQVAPLASDAEEPIPDDASAGTARSIKKSAVPESVGIGGVPFSEVIALCKAEAIQFTGKVAF